jgi:chitodextrinase
VSRSQINLLWTAATDNVGVTGYLVERCQGVACSAFAQIATATGTTYNDTGLAPNTSYSYRVRATDAAGNLGPYSNVASATTLAF